MAKKMGSGMKKASMKGESTSMQPKMMDKKMPMKGMMKGMKDKKG